MDNRLLGDIGWHYYTRRSNCDRGRSVLISRSTVNWSLVGSSNWTVSGELHRMAVASVSSNRAWGSYDSPWTIIIVGSIGYDSVGTWMHVVVVYRSCPYVGISYYCVARMIDGSSGSSDWRSYNPVICDVLGICV